MSSADRLFLDANVLFSAAYREDAGIGALWALDAVILLSSTYAAEEARRNLDTDEQKRRLQKLLQDVELSDARVDPQYRAEIEGSALPEKDLPILESAIGSGATHLLTGDRKHFGHLYGSRIAGLLVLKPADYLDPRRGQPGSGN